MPVNNDQASDARHVTMQGKGANGDVTNVNNNNSQDRVRLANAEDRSPLPKRVGSGRIPMATGRLDDASWIQTRDASARSRDVILREKPAPKRLATGSGDSSWIKASSTSGRRSTGTDDAWLRSPLRVRRTASDSWSVSGSGAAAATTAPAPAIESRGLGGVGGGIGISRRSFPGPGKLQINTADAQSWIKSDVKDVRSGRSHVPEPKRAVHSSEQLKEGKLRTSDVGDVKHRLQTYQQGLQQTTLAHAPERQPGYERQGQDKVKDDTFTARTDIALKSAITKFDSSVNKDVTPIEADVEAPVRRYERRMRADRTRRREEGPSHDDTVRRREEGPSHDNTVRRREEGPSHDDTVRRREEGPSHDDTVRRREEGPSHDDTVRRREEGPSHDDTVRRREEGPSHDDTVRRREEGPSHDDTVRRREEGPSHDDTVRRREEGPSHDDTVRRREEGPSHDDTVRRREEGPSHDDTVRRREEGPSHDDTVRRREEGPSLDNRVEHQGEPTDTLRDNTNIINKDVTSRRHTRERVIVKEPEEKASSLHTNLDVADDGESRETETGIGFDRRSRMARRRRWRNSSPTEVEETSPSKEVRRRRRNESAPEVDSSEWGKRGSTSDDSSTVSNDVTEKVGEIPPHSEDSANDVTTKVHKEPTAPDESKSKHVFLETEIIQNENRKDASRANEGYFRTEEVSRRRRTRNVPTHDSKCQNPAVSDNKDSVAVEENLPKGDGIAVTEQVITVVDTIKQNVNEVSSEIEQINSCGDTASVDKESPTDSHSSNVNAWTAEIKGTENENITSNEENASESSDKHQIDEEESMAIVGSERQDTPTEVCGSEKASTYIDECSQDNGIETRDEQLESHFNSLQETDILKEESNQGVETESLHTMVTSETIQLKYPDSNTQEEKAIKILVTQKDDSDSDKHDIVDESDSITEIADLKLEALPSDQLVECIDSSNEDVNQAIEIKNDDMTSPSDEMTSLTSVLQEVPHAPVDVNNVSMQVKTEPSFVDQVDGGERSTRGLYEDIANADQTIEQTTALQHLDMSQDDQIHDTAPSDQEYSVVEVVDDGDGDITELQVQENTPGETLGGEIIDDMEHDSLLSESITDETCDNRGHEFLHVREWEECQSVKEAVDEINEHHPADSRRTGSESTPLENIEVQTLQHIDGDSETDIKDSHEDTAEENREESGDYIHNNDQLSTELFISDETAKSDTKSEASVCYVRDDTTPEHVKEESKAEMSCENEHQDSYETRVPCTKKDPFSEIPFMDEEEMEETRENLGDGSSFKDDAVSSEPLHNSEICTSSEHSLDLNDADLSATHRVNTYENEPLSEEPSLKGKISETGMQDVASTIQDSNNNQTSNPEINSQHMSVVRMAEGISEGVISEAFVSLQTSPNGLVGVSENAVQEGSTDIEPCATDVEKSDSLHQTCDDCHTNDSSVLQKGVTDIAEEISTNVLSDALTSLHSSPKDPEFEDECRATLSDHCQTFKAEDGKMEVDVPEVISEDTRHPESPDEISEEDLIAVSAVKMSDASEDLATATTSAQMSDVDPEDECRVDDTDMSVTVISEARMSLRSDSPDGQERETSVQEVEKTLLDETDETSSDNDVLEESDRSSGTVEKQFLNLADDISKTVITESLQSIETASNDLSESEDGITEADLCDVTITQQSDSRVDYSATSERDEQFAINNLEAAESEKEPVIRELKEIKQLTVEKSPPDTVGEGLSTETCIAQDKVQTASCKSASLSDKKSEAKIKSHPDPDEVIDFKLVAASLKEVTVPKKEKTEVSVGYRRRRRPPPSEEKIQMDQLVKWLSSGPYRTGETGKTTMLNGNGDICYSELILEVFEESETLFFPLQAQKEARAFIKALHMKGISYEALCQEIGEHEHNFTSWRKSLGRAGIGHAVMLWANRPLQDLLDDGEDEDDGMDDAETEAEQERRIEEERLREEEGKQRLQPEVEHEKVKKSLDFNKNDQKDAHHENHSTESTTTKSSARNGVTMRAGKEASPPLNINKDEPQPRQKYEQEPDPIRMRRLQEFKRGQEAGKGSEAEQMKDIRKRISMFESQQSPSKSGSESREESENGEQEDEYEEESKTETESLSSGSAGSMEEPESSPEPEEPRPKSPEPLTESPPVVEQVSPVVEDSEQPPALSPVRADVVQSKSPPPADDNKGKDQGDSTSPPDVSENYNSDLDPENDMHSPVQAIAARKIAASRTNKTWSGFLYVFSDTPANSSTCRVKVGASAFPHKRLRQAQLFNPDIYQIHTVAVKQRSTALEQVLTELEQHRLPDQKDWFEGPFNDILAAISDVAARFPSSRKIIDSNNDDGDVESAC